MEEDFQDFNMRFNDYWYSGNRKKNCSSVIVFVHSTQNFYSYNCKNWFSVETLPPSDWLLNYSWVIFFMMFDVGGPNPFSTVLGRVGSGQYKKVNKPEKVIFQSAILQGFCLQLLSWVSALASFVGRWKPVSKINYFFLKLFWLEF